MKNPDKKYSESNPFKISSEAKNHPGVDNNKIFIQNTYMDENKNEAFEQLNIEVDDQKKEKLIHENY